MCVIHLNQLLIDECRLDVSWLSCKSEHALYPFIRTSFSSKTCQAFQIVPVCHLNNSFISTHTYRSARFPIGERRHALGESCETYVAACLKAEIKKNLSLMMQSGGKCWREEDPGDRQLWDLESPLPYPDCYAIGAHTQVAQCPASDQNWRCLACVPVYVWLMMGFSEHITQLGISPGHLTLVTFKRCNSNHNHLQKCARVCVFVRHF